jgi:hypothetical protein
LFRITARTVLELGSELISSDIIAFYELIKNAFDARTKSGVNVQFDIVLSRHVYLTLQERIAHSSDLGALKHLATGSLLDNATEAARTGFLTAIDAAHSPAHLRIRLEETQARFNTITVSDTGSGMSLVDLARNFLVIGTASRKREVEAALAAGAAETPYLGEKGIGRLSAMRLGERLRVETARQNDEVLNILEIDWRAFGDVDAMLDQIPVPPEPGPPKPEPAWSGTSIVVSTLTENWTEARVRDMANYDFARLTDPFADAASRPRIAILWNGERISIPFMPSALIDAAHARVSGLYQITDGKPELRT